jgi:hypothetical protein
MSNIVEPEALLPSHMPPRSSLEYQPPAAPEVVKSSPPEADAEPTPTDPVVTYKPKPLPVRQCPHCKAAIGPMLASDVVCPRRQRKRQAA